MSPNCARSDWNRAYYGQPYSARQIVIEMQGANPGADPLREILTRYGSATVPMDEATATAAMAASTRGSGCSER